jgi:Protein of unknown function (DUF4058)
MPSPFPGMDPFLEDPAVFSDLHDRLIVCLSEALNAQLPEPYYAGIGSRVWVQTAQRRIVPDVSLVRPRQTANGGVSAGGAGVAVAEAVRTEPVVVHVPREEIRETFLEIYAQPGGERLVTTVEVLSPANKSPGIHSRDLYLQKQEEILNNQVHLVEIDLLHSGAHTTAVPLEQANAKAGSFDYHVCVHRFDRPDDYFVYPIQLRARLPEIAIPLLADDPAVPIDLQALLDRCYDTGQYHRRVRYGEYAPLLSADDAEWVQRLLREKGIIPATQIP